MLPVKSSLGSSLDCLDVMGLWLRSGRIVWVWLCLVMLDMMVNETWHVSSMVYRRLCGYLGWVSTFCRVVECQPSIVCPTHIVNRVLMLKNLKCRMLST
jgi:hypothetical protein